MLWILNFLLLPALGAGGGPTEDVSAADREFFEREIRPLLAENCTSCHGPDRQRAGLRLDSREGLQKGGESGPVVVPGDPDSSRLLRAVSYADVDLQMPPRGRLPDDRLAALRRWVESGAAWPEDSAGAGAPKKEAAAFDLAARRAAHWCWQPIGDPPVPDVDGLTGLDPIDAFLLDRLSQEGVAPGPRADTATLLRRLHFTITGLPPTPEELESFLADTAPGALERRIDALLHSPHYAEQWARHWLDLVRYAETFGHEFDYPIPYAYQYRDYLIRAIDADVPYDQLLVEHLAGDLLEEPRRNPENGIDESILGTGFWFFHQATHSPVDVRQDEAERVDNQIDVFTKGFLGLTVSCARCHDHKFDAISTADFYSFAGYLQSSNRQFAYLDPGGTIATTKAQLVALADEGTTASASTATPAPERLAHAFLGAADLLQRFGPDRTVREAEALPVKGEVSGHWRAQGMDDRWTDRKHMWWTDGKVGDTLSLGFEVPRSTSACEIVLHLTRAPDYAQVQPAVDGTPLGPVVDLYEAHVVPSGPVVLGTLPLEAGEHTLSFQIVGHHESAEPALMVGLDQLVLRDVDPGRIEARTAAKAALLTELPDGAPLLDRATDLLADPVGVSDLDPRRVFVRGLAAVENAADENAAAQSLRDALGNAPEPAAGGRPLFTFDQGLEGWTVTGHAFADAPTRGGEWLAALGASPPRFAEPGVVGTAQYGRRLQGSIVSPTFLLEQPSLLHRIAGERCKVRVIVDGYTMDVFNSLIYEGVSFDVNTGGEWRWIRQASDLARVVGHRVHLEIHDEGDGWVMLDEVRTGEGPVPSDTDPRFALAVLGRYEAARAASAAEPREQSFARAFAAELTEGARAWLLGHDLLPEATGPLASIAARSESLDATLPEPMRALAMLDGTAEDEYVFVRGSHKNQGPTVPRRNLEAFGGTRPSDPEHGSGRLELARALIAPDNPLVARVAVNRVWHHLFGRGLVETVDNFGVLGRAPSHPELLDHLANWFRTEGHWSTRALVRRILLTEAWQRSSDLVDAEAETRDPQNLLLHRQNLRRLEGESIRDALLDASGRLDEKRFGPPVPVHLTPFLDGRGRPGSSGPLDGDGRRSIYQEVRRNFLPPFLLAFDFPLPASTVGARSVSNVPAQGLVMLNDPFVHAQAKLLAEHLVTTQPDAGARAQELVERLFGRSLREGESEAFQDFLATQVADGLDEPQAVEALVHVLFNTKEFVFLR